MPKRSSKKTVEETPPPEPIAPVVEQPAEEPAQAPPDGKNPAAVALGRLGGKKGGIARAAALTKKQRSEIAKKAAEARWKNAK